VRRASELDVDGVKISVYFDPDGDTAAAGRFVTDVAAQCEATGTPLFCEPLALYGRPEDRRRAVLEGVRIFGHLGADVLKLQFPEPGARTASGREWVEACRKVDRLSPVPWTILSEGGDYGLFRQQLRAACRAGASGFLAGRAVWREAATGQGIEYSNRERRLIGEVLDAYGRARDAGNSFHDRCELTHRFTEVCRFTFLPKQDR